MASICLGLVLTNLLFEFGLGSKYEACTTLCGDYNVPPISNSGFPIVIGPEGRNGFFSGSKGGGGSGSKGGGGSGSKPGGGSGSGGSKGGGNGPSGGKPPGPGPSGGKPPGPGPSGGKPPGPGSGSGGSGNKPPKPSFAKRFKKMKFTEAVSVASDLVGIANTLKNWIQEIIAAVGAGSAASNAGWDKIEKTMEAEMDTSWAD